MQLFFSNFTIFKKSLRQFFIVYDRMTEAVTTKFFLVTRESTEDIICIKFLLTTIFFFVKFLQCKYVAKLHF